MNTKAVFDTVRKMLGRGFTQAEVDALDAALKPDPPSAPEVCSTPSKVGPQGIALIKSFEGCERRLPSGMLAAYPDPGTGNLPITIGWGSTMGRDNKPIPRDAVMSQEQVDALFERDLASYAAEVRTALGSAIDATSQAQFDALVSFHYNTGAIASATLTRKHRAGDFAGAAAEFGRWVKSKGKTMPGLVRRRKAEAALYRSGSQ